MNNEIIVYVLLGKNGQRLVGTTNNIKQRIQDHKKLELPEDQALGEFSLFRTERFHTFIEAKAREKYLKSAVGSKFLNDLVEHTRRPGIVMNKKK